MSAFYDQASLVVVPSGYKSGKIYAQKPLTTDGQLTFTRASTATRVNASGLIESVASGVPRLDYLGSSCPKILLEPQRTNSQELSENFGSYPLFNVTVATSSVTSPDGGTNAWRMTATAALGVIYSPRAATGIHTVSVFCKYVNTPNMRIGFSDIGGDYEGVFNVQNGTVVSSTAGITSAKIEAYSNGWYRCSVTRTITGTSFNMYFGASAAGGVFDFFGAQLEAAAYATSYIKTTGAAVTRLADAASKTGITSLIGQTEGTLFAEFYWDGKPIENWILSVQTSVTNFVAMFLLDDGRPYFYILNSGSVQMAYVGTALSVGYHKFAFGYAANNSVAYIDGVLKNTDTSCTIPATSEVRIGSVQTPVTQAATIKQALVFKTRLTNAQLAELTTL